MQENSREDSESVSNSTRRKFLEYAALGTAGVAILASGGAGLLSTAAAATGAQASAVKLSPTGGSNGINVVLVHGVWADATSYRFVIPLLLNAGYTVWAPQIPETTHLADDVDAALGVIKQAVGPTVLVGHSYGGAVITNAGAGLSNVIGLVYCDAFAPAKGEFLGQFTPGPGLANLYPVVYPNNLGTFLFLNQQKFHESFCADVDPATAAIMAIVQKPANSNIITDKTTEVAWEKIPSWYLIGGKDLMVPPSVQEMFANRMKAKKLYVPDSSHCSIVSHPRKVFELIQQAAGRSD